MKIYIDWLQKINAEQKFDIFKSMEKEYLDMDMITFLNLNIEMLRLFYIIFLKITFSKFANTSCGKWKNILKSTCSKWMYGLFVQNHLVAIFYTLYCAKYIRNQDTKFEFHRTIITYSNNHSMYDLYIKISKIDMFLRKNRS